MREAIWRVSASSAPLLSPTTRGQRTTTPPAVPVERLISGASNDVREAIVGPGEGAEAAGLGVGSDDFAAGAGEPAQAQNDKAARAIGVGFMQSV